MRKIMFIATLALLSMMLASAGCGDEEETTTADDSSVTTVDSSPNGDSGTSADVPDDFDFEAAGERYVEAAAAGDCVVAAELYGYADETQSTSSRDVVISNCEKLTPELAGLGEPTATTVRKEGQTDGEVTVWVTREYADGSQWEMMFVFREKTGKGWVISTTAYGMKQQAE